MGDSSLRQRGTNGVPSSVTRRRRWMYERSLPPSASVEDDEDEEEDDDDDVDEKAEDDEEATDSDDDNDNGLDDNKKQEYGEDETTSSDSSSVSVNNDNRNRRANCRFRSVSSRRKRPADKDINDDIVDDIVMSEDKDSFGLLSGNERTGNDRSSSSSSSTALFSQMHLHSNTKSLPLTSDRPSSYNVDADDDDCLNDVDADDCLNDSCIFSIFDETNNRLVEPPMLHKQIEKAINVPIRLKDISAKISLHKNPNYAPFMCNPMKLNLLNVHQKINDDVPQPLSDMLSQSASEILRSKWSNVGLWFDASSEETRVDERHCLLPLQITLLREWCLLNLISCNDVYQVFGT